ncbi:MAG: YIP1 family protein [Mailhella sp.]|nr:YIP1 family protein [Mailhella sp.]
MYITCPICGYERHLQENIIPDTASVASCPKCGGKFRIRDPQSADFIPGIITSDEQHRRILADRALEKRRAAEEARRKAAAAAAAGPAGDPPAQEAGGEAPAGGNKEKPLDMDGAPREEKQRGKTQTGQRSSSRRYGDDDVPWEHPERYGWLGAFWRTIVRVMFHPGDFFGSFRRSNISPMRPAIFFAVMGLFRVIMTYAWGQNVILESLQEAGGNPQILEALRNMLGSIDLPMTILMTPFLRIFELVLFAAFLHLMVRLAMPENADFSTTLRVVAYSSAPEILNVVPAMLISLVGSAWYIACLFIGMRAAHRLTWGKTVMAVLPGFIIWTALSIQYYSTNLSSFL